MAFYRKKPIVIEAERFFITESLPFRDEKAVLFGCDCETDSQCYLCNQFHIATPEGHHIITNGDWIVKGIKGEFYPVKSDIFEATYELAEATK